MNLGVRYERIGDFAEQNGRNSSFNIALANPDPPFSGSQAGYVVPSNYTGAVPFGSVRSGNTLAIDGKGQSTWASRFGFALQMLPTSSRFVLRGGYGIYYSTLIGEQWVQDAFSPPWSTTRALVGTTNANASWANPYGRLYSPSDFPMFPAYLPSSQLTLKFPALDSRPPITQQYSLNLQTQFANNYQLEVGYVGSRATHLVETVSLNQAVLASPSGPIRGQTTNTLANLPLRVPVEGFTATGLSAIQTSGDSWYNALQASLTKRFSSGLQFLASYSFARLFDTEGGTTSGAGVLQLVTGNQRAPSARYGPSSMIRPHRVVVSFVYDLPRTASKGFAAGVLNNWSLSGVTTVQSGHPLTIFSQNPRNVFGITGDFGQWAPGCTASQLERPGSITSKLRNYFNSACIGAYPIVGADGIATGFGNMGAGIAKGPSQANIDLAITKRVPVRWFDHNSTWDFRAEFFNVLNTPNFADPDTKVSDGAAFGVISSTIANPRIIQFALKYNF
jgi:hypothetical protein